MRKTSYLALLSALTFVLVGCQLTDTPAPSAPVNVPVEPAKQEPDAVYEHRPALTPAATNWDAIVSPLIADMLKAPQPITSHLLLISDVQNNTGEYIPFQQINRSIAQQVQQQGQYSLIDKTRVNQAKQALGMPSDDTLVSRSKMIALGRYLEADLVLFSAVNQLAKAPDSEAKLSMELLSAKSGEIIWRMSSEQVANTQTAEQAATGTSNH